MRKLNQYIMLASFILLLVSFWNRNAFPENMPLVNEIKTDPQQKQVNIQPISINFNDISYTVKPIYEYDLYGLVVSYRHHDGDSQLHKLWNDHLNMMDLCVLWSDTAFSSHLNELEFWNGQFTCNVKTVSNVAWASFKMNQISNNHLLSADPRIRERVKDVRIGDQIHLKGWLSSYSSVGGSKRSTSTTREDTGNGACETIYLQEFNIIQSTDSGWRKLMYMALALLMITLTIYLRMPYRPYPE